MNNETKICRDCNLEKPLTDFYPAKTTRDKRTFRCSPCQIAFNREYRNGRIEASARSSAKQVTKREYNQRFYDAEGEYKDIRDRNDFKALRSAVLGYLEKVGQRRSRREIWLKMSKLRLIPEQFLHTYLETILTEAVDDGALDISGSVIRPLWRYGRKAAATVAIKAIDHRTTNSQLFGKVARQVNPFAEAVYSKI
jgi:hypothetical protein